MSKIFKEQNVKGMMPLIEKLDPQATTVPVTEFNTCQELHGGWGGTCTCGYECETGKVEGYVRIVTSVSGKKLHKLLKQTNPNHKSIWE